MGKVIGPPLKPGDKKWILEQKVFFHASAPLSKNHRVNVSPKSSKEFRIIDDCTVAWMDLTGSGSETCSHIFENGRLTILFVAFTGGPRIIRLHGIGKVVLPHELKLQQNEYLMCAFGEHLPGEVNSNIGFRCVIVMKIERVSQSCGYSIPFYDYVKERETLEDVTNKQGCDGIKKYRQLKNGYSIDGLPSIAQKEMQVITQNSNTAPVEIEYKDGYVFVNKYGQNWLSIVAVRMQLWWKFNTVDLFPTVRDVLYFSSGVLAGGAVLQWYGSKRGI